MRKKCVRDIYWPEVVDLHELHNSVAVKAVNILDTKQPCTAEGLPNFFKETNDASPSVVHNDVHITPYIQSLFGNCSNAADL